ncbi:hypothetical protein C0J52_11455 [Blattella germanica]|nr:hypothetical protein C0J52_11455 [Blattella germanica]
MFLVEIFKQIAMRKSVLLFFMAVFVKCAQKNGDLYLWIDEQQVKMFSGFSMQIYAIVDGHVLPYILDPNFEKYLPIIPSEVGYVNFTWKSGVKKYYYNFDRLQSFDEAILEPPVISIKTKGRIPRRPKDLAPVEKIIFIFPGICAEKCLNGGKCIQKDTCDCPKGYYGLRCEFNVQQVTKVIIVKLEGVYLSGALVVNHAIMEPVGLITHVCVKKAGMEDCVNKRSHKSVIKAVQENYNGQAVKKTYLK